MSAEYLDPRADRQKLQVVRLRQLFGEPGERLTDLFSDWAVASTVPLASKRKIRTVDGSYINAYTRPMKAKDIQWARKEVQQRRAYQRGRRILRTGSSPDSEPLMLLPSDPDAYPRTISHPGGRVKHCMGYVATAQRRVDRDGEYIEKVRVDSADKHEYEQGADMLLRSLAEKMELSYFLADRGFSQNPGFRRKVRDRDVDLIFDLKSNQRGPDGTYRGCLVEDGWLYLPSLPEELRSIKALPLNASKEKRAAWKAQMLERDRYALKLKQRLDAKRVRVTSPALRTPGAAGERGPGCRHPKLAHTLRWRDPDLAVCPGNHRADQACGLKNATWWADFSKRTEACFSAVHFGSKAWFELYAGRASSERGFNLIKNRDAIGLHDGSIRWRGLMRVTLLVTLAVATHNLWLTNPQASQVPRPPPRTIVWARAA